MNRRFSVNCGSLNVCFDNLETNSWISVFLLIRVRGFSVTLGLYIIEMNDKVFYMENLQIYINGNLRKL